MAGGRRSGADRVLESRHLVGLFLGVVLLCGVFFTLGYVMGKTQYGGAVHADPLAKIVTPATAHRASPGRDAGTSPAADDAPASSAPAASEWDFYSKKNTDHLEPARVSSPAPAVAHPDVAGTGANHAAAPATVPAVAHFQAPHLVKGSIVLQIAALTRQGDALAMADELQKKKFPAFVVAPAADNFYRVQVGPYADQRAADAAKAALDHAGFKAITKR